MVKNKLWVVVALFCAGCMSPSAETRSASPNIVVIFVDDLGWGDIGVQGALGYATPHIDSLAADGLRLTDFYAAQPVCSASRAALLTGCYPNRIGIHGALGPAGNHGIADGEVTLAELCRSEGYATAIFGKWHLGHLPRFLPTRHGFDEFYGIPYSNDMWPYHPESPKAWPDLPTLEGEGLVGANTDQRRFTGDFTRRAVDFIERNALESFFLLLAHPMPHVPLFASADFEGRTTRGLFGDVIEEIDWSVGQVLAVLDRLGIADETLVIFASDNGPWLSYGDHAGSTGPLREGKGTTFEGGVRVPCLMRFPGRIPAGSVCSEPVMAIDVFPTVARLIGAPLPDHAIDGLDIWSLLSDPSRATSPHEALFFYYHKNHLEALRAGRWKLHLPHSYRTMEGRELGSGGTPGKYNYQARVGLELYDLENDVGESRDLAASRHEKVAELLDLVEAQRARLGDALTKTAGDPFELRAAGRVEEL